MHYRRGDYKSALPLLEQAAGDLPNSALVQYHLGANYLAIGENAKAAELLQKSLGLASQDDDLLEKVRTAMKQIKKDQ